MMQSLPLRRVLLSACAAGAPSCDVLSCAAHAHWAASAASQPSQLQAATGTTGAATVPGPQACRAHHTADLPAPQHARWGGARSFAASAAAAPAPPPGGSSPPPPSASPQAFAHHQQPPHQHDPAQPSDAIHIRGARFYGYHGVLPGEREVGQPFVVDLTLYCDLRAAGATDQLQHTVSYADVFTTTQRVVEGQPHQLLESVVHHVARAVLHEHAPLCAVRVAISKVHIPGLSAAVQSVGVEVYRTRADFGLPPNEQHASIQR